MGQVTYRSSGASEEKTLDSGITFKSTTTQKSGPEYIDEFMYDPYDRETLAGIIPEMETISEKERKQKKYPTVNFDMFTPGADGVYEWVHYTNEQGNDEFVYGGTKEQIEAEVKHRTQITGASGAPNYRIDLDHTRVKGWNQGKPDIMGISTADQKYRLTSTAEGWITGRPLPRYQIYGDAGWGTKTYDPVIRDVSSRAVRTGLGTLNLIGVGDWIGREMAEIDHNHIFPNKDGENYTWEVPTKDDIQRMIEKPDSDFTTQFFEFILPGIGQTALLSKLINTGVRVTKDGISTVNRKSKVFHGAMRKTLDKMQKEGIYASGDYQKLHGAEKIAFRREWIQRARRDLVANLDEDVANTLTAKLVPWAGTKIQKMIRTGRFDAYLNPKAYWAGEFGAEFGLAASMVAAHQYFSSQPDDTMAIYGAGNMAIGVVGAMFMGQAAIGATSFGAYQAAKTWKSVAKLLDMEGEEFVGGSSALQALSENNRTYLDKLPNKQKKIAYKMVDDIWKIDDVEVRENIIQNAKESFAIIEDLRKLDPNNAEWVDKIDISMGQLFQVNNLMAAEDYLIRTAREGKTVHFNVVNLSSKIQLQRAAAQKHLEGLLNKVQAYGSGRPMEKNTIDFLKGVREGVKELRIENASKQVILDNALDMSIDAEIMKIGLRPTYTQENRKTLQELFDAHEDIRKLLPDDTTISAREKQVALKKIEEKIRLSQKVLAQKHLADMLEYKGDTNKLAHSAVSMFYDRGEFLRNQCSKKFEKAKQILKGFALGGDAADNHIQEAYRMMDVDELDKVIGREGGEELRKAINNTYSDLADDALDQLISAVAPDPHQYSSIKKTILKHFGKAEITNNPLAFLNTIVGMKKSGRSFAGIDSEVIKNLDIEIDVLNQYGIGQVLNNQIAKISKNLKKAGEGTSRLQNSKLQEIANKHQALIKRFEDYAPEGQTQGSQVWQNYEESKKYWREVVVPATYNNPLWYKLRTTKDAGPINFEKAGATLEKELKDPHEFVRNLERLFGEYDPELGKHVIIKNSNEHVNVQSLLNNYYGDLVAKEAKKIDAEEAFKRFSVDDKTFNQLKLDDDAINSINASQLGWGKNRMDPLVKSLDDIEDALKETPIDISGAVYSPRAYNRLFKESEQARQSFSEAGDAMKAARQRWKPTLARIKESEKIFIEELNNISTATGKVMPPKHAASFLKELVFPNQGDYIKQLKNVLVDNPATKRMTEKEFKLVLRRQVASGLRQMSEEPIPKVDIEKIEGKRTAMSSKRVNGAEFLFNVQENKDVLIDLIGKEHTRHIEIIAKGMELIQRHPVSASATELMKASKMTAGGMTSRLYAVFSGRVSWRYVGAEALFLNMAKNEAAAVTAILADENAAKAVAYMMVSGKPITNKIRSADKAIAWLPEVAMFSQDLGLMGLDDMWESSRDIRKIEQEEEARQMESLFEEASFGA